MGTVSRSAKTGKFVPARTATRNPKTTITQHVPGTTGTRHRSAISGRFVKEATARRHPDTTVREG